ncbi:hypothetical protein ACQEV2_41255 [Streptomyces sp. CA-251387]|uniref:hypothetical protein n=1 Tax=Streptomyces sp. CA-251387 TaxID=3240064 RepID=UPI003D8B96E9
MRLADIGTLDRDRDILMPTGLLVLPEPVVVVNHTGSLSDTPRSPYRSGRGCPALPVRRP